MFLMRLLQICNLSPIIIVNAALSRPFIIARLDRFLYAVAVGRATCIAIGLIYCFQSRGSFLSFVFCTARGRLACAVPCVCCILPPSIEIHSICRDKDAEIAAEMHHFSMHKNNGHENAAAV